MKLFWQHTNSPSNQDLIFSCVILSLKLISKQSVISLILFNPRGQSLSKITAIFQISEANFKFLLIFIQISSFMANLSTNFIEILLAWRSCDVFQLVKFLKTEKGTRLIRLVYLVGNSKRKYPNKISNFIFDISNFTEGFYDISRSDQPLSSTNTWSDQYKTGWL